MFPSHRNILLAGCLAALAFTLLAMTAGKPSGSEAFAQRRLVGPRAARSEDGRPAGGLFAPRSTPEERLQRRNLNPGADAQGRSPNADADTPVPPRRLFMSQRERMERQEALRQRMDNNQEVGTRIPPAASQPGSGTVRRTTPERTPPRARPRNSNIPVPPQESGPMVFGPSILNTPATSAGKDEKKLSEMSADEIMLLMGEGDEIKE